MLFTNLLDQVTGVTEFQKYIFQIINKKTWYIPSKKVAKEGTSPNFQGNLGSGKMLFSRHSSYFSTVFTVLHRDVSPSRVLAELAETLAELAEKRMLSLLHATQGIPRISDRSKSTG